MTDILGQALEKIASPEVSTQPEQPHASAPVAASNVAVLADVPVPQPPVIEEYLLSASPTSAEQIPVTPLAVTRSNPLQYLLSHRRQAAAVVVAICIAVFWFDGGSTSVHINSDDSNSAQTDTAEEELMLDEFDAIEVSPLREPAEPSHMAAADPFPLTIPQVESDPGQAEVSSRGSEHPLLNERIGDVRNQSAVQAESSGSLEFPVQPSSDNSAPAIPRSVRFTGRIQPLN